MGKHDDDIVELDSLIRKCKHKFNQKSLNDVVSIVLSKPDEVARNQLLELLFNTGFVKEVIWKQFNGDVTDKHLELLVTLAVYDSRRNNSGLVDSFLNHKDVMVVFDRLLGITQDSSFQNTRFRISALVFISWIAVSGTKLADGLVGPLFDLNIWSCLITQIPLLKTNQIEEKYKLKVSEMQDSLKTTKGSYNLKSRWLLHIVNGYSNGSNQWKEAVVKFFISITKLQRYRDSVSPFLISLGVVSLFRISNDKGIQDLVSIIDSILIQQEVLEFVLLQQKVQEMFSDKKELTEKVIGFASRYSCTRQEMYELFESHFTLEDANKLLQYFNKNEVISNYACLGLTSEMNKSFFIDVILSRFFPVQLNSFAMAFNFWNIFSETDIDTDFYLESEFPRHFNSYIDLETEITYRQLESAKAEIFKHISTVMSRIKVDSASSFKGTSKYFMGIKSITPIFGTKYQVVSNVVPDRNYILLVELIKPDSRGSNLRKLGLRSLRICKTEKSSKSSMVIQCENLDYQDVYKNFIVLPDLKNIKYLDRLQEIERRNAKIPSYSFGSNNQEDVEPPAKKQKIENSRGSSIEYVRTAKFSNIDQILTKYQNQRTLVLTASQSAVRHYSTTSPLVRFGCEESIHELIQLAKEYYHDLTKSMESLEKPFDKVTEFDLISLKQKWSKPFQTSENNVDSSSWYDDVKTKLRFIVDVLPVRNKSVTQSTWQYLVNRFSAMVSSEDFFAVMQDAECAPFDVVIFWNCNSSTLPLTFRKQPSAMKVIVVNGELLDYFPPKNITYLSAFKANTDSFNPGFVFKNQLLSVKSQVEEAEYCVLLYFYMRLLGYPSESILIWVSCRRMEILIGEVVSSKPDLKKKLGTPEILYNKLGEHDYVQVSYSIISMFSDEGYTEVEFSGKQGNYFVSSVLQRDSKLLQNTRLGPGNDLCIVKGGAFGAKQERSLKGQEHKLKGISQLEKMVRSLE